MEKPLNIIKFYKLCFLTRLGDDDMVEYLVRVKWIKAFDREQAKWKKNGGLFTSQLIRASLQGQPKTIEYLEKEFEIKFSDLLTK
jgi:hypothetical protein